MWLLLVMYTHIVDAADNSLITLRDENFIGPDKQLEINLSKRRIVPTDELEDLMSITNSTLTMTNSNISWVHLEEIYRRTLNKKTVDVEPMVLELIKFYIYYVNSRLEDIDPIVKKYEMDERFRFGQIFCTLDHWKRETKTWYMHLTKTKLRGYLQILYYEHILSRNIDVTYTIKFLAHLQAKYTENNLSLPKGEDDKSMSNTDSKKLQMLKEELEKYNGKELTEEQRKELENKLLKG